MRPVLLTAYTMSSALGRGLAPTRAALRDSRTGLAKCGFDSVALETFVGEIPDLDATRLPKALAAYDCRNNRGAEAGLGEDDFEQAVAAAAARHGRDRIGVILGTSTAGILHTELAYRQRDASGALPAGFDYRRTHNTSSVAEFVRARLGLAGPLATISTACSSSAKAFASAARLMRAGVIDAAIVGGVDTLCLTTLHGFHSLQLLSPQPCRPYDEKRDGISLGEAAVFFLLERAEEGADPQSIALLGVGESCDAYHMSAPHPEGRGARDAMQGALESASLGAQDIDYVNLHGTGTPANDSAEDRAVLDLFGSDIPVNSTKGMTGHALGAAGAAEALISVLALEEQRIPASPGTHTIDPALHAAYQVAGGPRALARVMTNSFGFGGSNCSLVFGRLRDAG